MYIILVLIFIKKKQLATKMFCWQLFNLKSLKQYIRDPLVYIIIQLNVAASGKVSLQNFAIFKATPCIIHTCTCTCTVLSRASAHPPILTVLWFFEVLHVTAHHAKIFRSEIRRSTELT